MPHDHTAEQYYFGDLSVGDTFNIPSKTVTEAHHLLFAAISGDSHPIHLDRHYVEEKTGFSERVAHGLLLTIFTVIGASSLSQHIEDSTVAFLRQSSEFHNPVVVGDTVYPSLEVAEKRPQDSTGVVVFDSEIRNQNDEVVLTGQLELLLERREAD